MTDFAKSQLMKYGWTEGKGLGKNETGITEALKPKLKFDKAGIDHKNTEWNEWWETAFNKAANNILVESQTHGVSISVSSKTEESFKDNLSGKKSKYMMNYTNFQKTSTLINGNLIKEDNSNLSKVEKTETDVTHVPLTDEELFKVCGGRTGHKGARHGLTLNGKLQRIAQQEKDLLSASTCMLDKVQRHDNKCWEYRYEIDNNENTLLPVAPSSEEESYVPKVSKTARKRNKKRINDLTHKLNILCNVSDNDEKNNCALERTEMKLKRRKKKKREESALTHDVECFRKEEEDKAIDCIPLPVGRKLEKKIEESGQGQITDHNGEEFENVLMCRKKKKKSKRKKGHDYQNGDTVTVCEDDFISTQAKKLKKSYKSDSSVQDFIKNDNINMLDNKHCCTESLINSNEIRNAIEHSESLDTCFSEEIDRLNARIAKRKKAKHNRKQKARLDKITASLEAVHFDAKESVGNKNSKNNINTVVKKIVESDIAVNKTESLKKLVKHKKKK